MPTLSDILGTGPGSIDAVIKVAPLGVDLDEDKTQGREHRQLLKDMIAALQASITTPPAAPAGAEWVSKPSTSINSATVSITAGAATFDGVTVNYTAYSKTLALPATGLIRQDAFAALPNGTYYYIQGTAGTTILTPNIPANALFVAYVLLSAQGGVVQNPNAGQTVTPLTLTDAATITIDGSQSINFNLNNPSLVTALSFANTLPGYWYTLDITGNTTEKTVNLTAISGVSFEGIEDNVITSVTIPVGGCQISYYHRSNTLRRVEVLAGGNSDGEFVPLSNPQGVTTTVAATLNPGEMELLTQFPSGKRAYLYGIENASLTLVNSPALLNAVASALYASDGNRDITAAAVIADGVPVFRISMFDILLQETTYFDFGFDGTIKVNGEEFAGGAPFTPITLNQFSTHPAFTSQHELNAWLLTNAYTK